MDGTWNATIADAKGSAVVQFNLFQDSGGNIQGTYATSLGGGGSMKGTIKGGVLTFEVTQSIQGCPGIFKGTATVAANKGTGTYTGSDCSGDHGTGTLTMTKAGPHALTPSEELAERQEMIKVSTPAYLQGKLYKWNISDARQMMGEPLAHRYGYDNAHNITSDIYSFKDPMFQMHHVELNFDSKTARMVAVFLYPNGMNWDDCRKLWGDNATMTANPDGTKLYNYKDRGLHVYLDKDSHVISLGIYAP
jgi:hypothetical protein